MLVGYTNMQMKTFAEANKVLKRFWGVRTRRGTHDLDTIIRLMDYLHNPQEKLKTIHVAGTSGKTSTAYFAASLLKAAGKRVGLIVSPHVDEMNERVQVDAVPLAEAEFCRELTVFLKLVEKSGLEPSYLETMVAFAWWEFVRAGMEYAVVEVGSGGLYDSTNVINREDKVCVITDIGLDHMNFLGTAVEQIAVHKAGIIQLHNSVFCYRQAPEIMGQIVARAQQKQADLYMLDDKAVESGLDFLPLFQQRNLGLARAAVSHLLEKHGGAVLTDELVAEATHTYIPARMEEAAYSGRTVIVDGSHNAQKLHALADSVRRKYPGQAVAVLVGFVGNRSYRLDDSVAELTQLAGHVIVTGFADDEDGLHNSEDPQALAELFRSRGAASVEVVADPAAALKVLAARPEPVLLVTGSFYLLNYIRPLLHQR